MRRRDMALGAVPFLLSGGLATAQGGAYPSRVIRMVVPYSAGSPADGGARVFSELLSTAVGQPVIVDNKPGGNGIVGTLTVKNAPADGYTLGFGGTSMYINPLFMKNIPYSPNDFRIIAPYVMTVPGIVVNAQSPYKDLDDLLKAAKTNGTGVMCATYTTIFQLGILWLAKLAGATFEPVLYKGGPEIVNDLLSNSVASALMAVTDIEGLVNEGKLRILATAGATRTSSMPAVPTIKETFPDYELWTLSSFIARRETPEPIVKMLADALIRARTTPVALDYYAKARVSPPVGDDAQALKQHQLSIERLTQIAHEVGIQPQ